MSKLPKRLLGLLLVAVMVIGLVGCGGDKKEEADSKQTGTTKESEKKSEDVEKQADKKVSEESKKSEETEESGKVTFPLKEPVTMTCFVHTRPNVDNFEDNAMTKWLEEKTNIDLNFVMVNDTEANSQLNLLLSTGDYPDLLLTSQLTYEQQALYGGQKMLVGLSDYIKNSKVLTEVFDLYPAAREMFTMSDGEIYNLPKISDCYHCKSTQKYWIYKPWLDKLGLKEPKTTEEFYEVLKAFKDQDPNGNGKKDEIPLAGCRRGWEGEVESFLMNAFVYASFNQYGKFLFIDNGKVKPAFTQEGWKEGLKYIQKLAAEGLLIPESFTMDATSLKRLGENPDDVILGCFPGGSVGVGLDVSGDRWQDYVAVEPLTGPDGHCTCKYNPYGDFAAGFSITDKCKYPDVAVALAELLYSKEATMMNWHGVEGEDWEWLPENTDKVGINGKKAWWDVLKSSADVTPNGFWNQMGCAIQSEELRLSQTSKGPKDLETMLYNVTRDKYVPHYPDVSVVMRPLQFTEEQSSELMTYNTGINTYLDEALVDFVLKPDSIDDKWDAYITNLENLGLSSMMKIYQEAYDAQ